MSNAVIVRLIGGIGNQMFQYAAGLALAQQLEKPLLLDTSNFEATGSRPYELDNLKITATPAQESSRPTGEHSSFISRFIQLSKSKRFYRERIAGDTFYKEPHAHFDPAFRELAGNQIYLRGFFQSARYFEGISDTIRREFQMRDELSELGRKWANTISGAPNSVSLHVRRGDYLSAQAAQVYTSLDLSYYRRAIALLKKIVSPDLNVFVFSDDPDFVRTAFAGEDNFHFVEASSDASWEDMFLMAKCQHNVIANSSYSWWGAWMNDNPAKTVIAPACWFTPHVMATRNVVDLYCDDWIILK